MIKVLDRQVSKRIVYDVFEILSNNEKKFVNTIDLMLYHPEMMKPSVMGWEKGTTIEILPKYQLFDINNNEYELFNKYLNGVLNDKSLLTKKNIAYALRLLYSFLVLNSYTIEDFNEDIVIELIYFLSGSNYISSNGINFELSIPRKSSTIKEYISTYNNFFKRMSFDISFSVWNVVFINKKIDELFSEKPEKPEKNYITPDEYKTLIELSKQEKNKSIRCIIEIIYNYGLKTGEVLGLTREDIVREGSSYYMFLRNRRKDRLFQKASGLQILPSSEISYVENDCDRYKIQWKIEISKGTYNSIQDLINDFDSFEMEQFFISKQLSAISITKEYLYSQNFYLFFNLFLSSKKVNLLNDQALNNSLIRLFKQADIPFDAKSSSSLTQKIRNGFAMSYTKFADKPISPTELQAKMRYANLSSVSDYYN